MTEDGMKHTGMNEIEYLIQEYEHKELSQALKGAGRTWIIPRSDHCTKLKFIPHTVTRKVDSVSHKETVCSRFNKHVTFDPNLLQMLDLRNAVSVSRIIVERWCSMYLHVATEKGEFFVVCSEPGRYYRSITGKEIGIKSGQVCTKKQFFNCIKIEALACRMAGHCSREEFECTLKNMKMECC